MKSIKNIDTNVCVSDVVHIYIRGRSFRKDFESQKNCINSLVRCVINPLVNAGIVVKISLCTYKNKHDYIFKEMLSQEKGVSDFYFEQYKPGVMGKCQIKNFCHVLRKISNYNESALIIRPDLFFLKEMDPERLVDSKFLIQWNAFHDTSSFEVPDQIHYIGRDIIKLLVPRLLENPESMGILSNGEGKGSLHNIYNRVYDILGSESDISYIYYFELSPDFFQGSRCLLRGNPEISNLNNIYKYVRSVSEVENVNFFRRIFRVIVTKARIISR